MTPHFSSIIHADLEEYDFFGDLSIYECTISDDARFYIELDGTLIESVVLELDSPIEEAVAPNPGLCTLLSTPITSQVSNASVDASGTTDEDFTSTPPQDSSSSSKKRGYSAAFDKNEEETKTIAGISVDLFLDAAEWADRELARFSLFGPLTPPVRKRQKPVIVPTIAGEDDLKLLKKETYRNRLVHEASPDAHWDTLLSHSAAQGILSELTQLHRFTDETLHNLDTNITRLERKQTHLEQMVSHLLPTNQPNF